jgi:vancomycin aglycone glucosyltransferase
MTMQMLISAVGTRGDVQPAVALAKQAQALGAQVRLCVPPNFTAWAEDLGFEARPVGVEMRAPARGSPSAPPPSASDLIADLFKAVGSAADGCRFIVAAGAHQYAARSIAESRGFPYVGAVYAPVSLPSPDLAPPGPPPGPDAGASNLELWEAYRRRWNERTLERVNANRAGLGLAALEDGLGHILTDRPWLAADTVLGPTPVTPDLSVVQTGAWMLPDPSGLPAELDAFLDAGEPPIYLGFGSMPVPETMSRALIEGVRSVGRRAILSKGWADLALIDDAPDIIAVGDVNHQALFARVAAIVHHGGAGTTTAAALSGAPQVVAPMFMDQFYWAKRVKALGMGAVVAGGDLNAGSLAFHLEEALQPAVAERAREVATSVSSDGAAIAARRLLDDYG